MPSRIIDLSHTVESGMITYKGLPAPLICDFLSYEDSHLHYAEGTEFQIGRIELVANTGTYVDSPAHRFRDGRDLAGLELETLADVEGIVVRGFPTEGRQIGAGVLDGVDVKGRAVLFETAWDRHWRTDQYFENHPFLTGDLAARLVEEGATIVGIDSYNIDNTEEMTRPVHTTLLGAGIPIVEHMTGLGKLPEEGFRFHAVPVKIKGMGTFPVRAYGIVDG